MNICGIICEYNPFHYGHAYHIQKARELTQCDVLICVMSGNFVQRGEPAICDKWQRARFAIEQGCDLVIELPYPYVMQSADHFALGGVRVLALAGIDSLVFGSESHNLTYLQELAKTSFADYKAQQVNGISFAKAIEQTHAKLSSNDILGVFYLKALQNLAITPYTIQRTNGYHDETLTSSFSSATAIRKAIKEHMDYKNATPMKEFPHPHWVEDYYPYLQTYFTTTSKEQLQSLFLMDEGIESLFIKKAKLCSDYASFLQSCVSKRYPTSSIQRTLMHVMCQTSKAEMNALPPLNYLRPLAFNTIGKAHLRTLQDQGVQISSSFTQIPAPYRSLELRAVHAYAHPLPLEQRAAVVQGELQPPVYIR